MKPSDSRRIDVQRINRVMDFPSQFTHENFVENRKIRQDLLANAG